MVRKNTKKKNGPPSVVVDDWDTTDEVLGCPAVRVIYLWGAPGTGKTYCATRKGAGDREVYSITLTGDTPASELRGFFAPKGNEFVWEDGVLIKAFKAGGRLVLNEISHASHDVLAILYPILESPETARLTLPTGETVVPAEGFQVVATDNACIDNLPHALQDRFMSVIRVDRPHPEALARLPEDLREAALRTFDLESERAVSIRGWIAVAELEEYFGRQKAFRVVFGPERGEQLFNALSLGAV